MSLRGVEGSLEREVERDRSPSSTLLRNRLLAEIVGGALQFFNGSRYDLFAWVVMPDHVHVVARFRDDLRSVIHTWKSYTSNAINEARSVRGRVWQRDYFDYWIRDVAELRKLCRYVAENPLNGGLADWPFVGTREIPEHVLSLDELR